MSFSTQYFRGKWYLINWATSEAVPFLSASACEDMCASLNALPLQVANGMFHGLALVRDFVVAETN